VFHTAADGLEGIVEIGGQGVFEVRWEGPSLKFILDRDCRLFTPNRKFLKNGSDVFFSMMDWMNRKYAARRTVGTVRNITTSCSWPRIGCRTRELVNLISPRRRFSRKEFESADR
jgi:hypothetical protein